MQKYITVFTGGEYPSRESACRYVVSGAQNYIIAADSGLETAEAFGFSPDLILGDMDSIRDKALLNAYPQDRVKTFIQDKDYTDTELALEEARNICPADSDDGTTVVLIGGDGGRIDHLLGIYDLFASGLRPDVWVCRQQALWYMKKGSTFALSDLAAGDPVSIARLSSGRQGGSIETNGLQWEAPLFRKTGMPSISNRISTAFFDRGKPVELTVTDGAFLLIVPLSAAVTCLRR